MNLDAILNLAVQMGATVVYTAEGWTVQEGAKTVLGALDAHARIIEANRVARHRKLTPAAVRVGRPSLKALDHADPLRCYWRGCREPQCRAANTAYMRDKKGRAA